MNDITDLAIFIDSIIRPIIKEAVLESIKEISIAPKPEHAADRFITRHDAAKLLGVGMTSIDNISIFFRELIKPLIDDAIKQELKEHFFPPKQVHKPIKIYKVKVK